MPSPYLQRLLYFVFNYNQLFFWMQIKTNCYYCYYYYFNSLQRLGLSTKQFLVLLKKLWSVDSRLALLCHYLGFQLTNNVDLNIEGNLLFVSVKIPSFIYCITMILTYRLFSFDHFKGAFTAVYSTFFFQCDRALRPVSITSVEKSILSLFY